MSKKIFLETFGCQMNVLDSELVQSQLASLGYTFTPVLEDAQVVLYNTCSVREHSEQKVWSRLGRLKARKAQDPSLVIGVVGCMAERDGVSLMRRMPHVDLMCGPSELDKLPSLLENVVLTGKRQHALAGNTSRRSQTIDEAAAGEDGLERLDLSRSFSPHENRYQAYIRIVRGCNKFCTYCVVPYTRGAEISRSPAAILEEARKLVDAGCLELTLLGQTVNHYVYEHPAAVSTATGPARRRTTFAELLAMLHDGIPDLGRLRFLTSFPADFGDDILHVMAGSPRICRYLHIPAQSGSNRILKLMNRGYTVESYLELLERVRRIVPGIALAGDIIVGFPTETDADYAATRTLVEQARYKNCFIFKYSPRPGTIAIRRHEDDIPDAIKRHRNNDLLHLQNRISEELSADLIGQTLEILCEGPSGWKDGYNESVVAGQSLATSDSPGNSDHGSGSVEFGPGLARAFAKSNMPIDGVKATPDVADVSPPNGAKIPVVQLTGRTSADQIVVFDGPVSLEGTMVPVVARRAHAMTIFGELAERAMLR